MLNPFSTGTRIYLDNCVRHPLPNVRSMKHHHNIPKAYHIPEIPVSPCLTLSTTRPSHLPSHTKP
ncbi:hypothetical protein E2C01_030843 [Portunus trituberculatus]|uniref:Uncharacterized protein n=1 Tax=Portunus trituberculatus TaxID=210409 RepID=A0A5B7EWG6_PORTR|nr:hypothetical protein [Portunus trituberculatus]